MSCRLFIHIAPVADCTSSSFSWDGFQIFEAQSSTSWSDRRAYLASQPSKHAPPMVLSSNSERCTVKQRKKFCEIFFVSLQIFAKPPCCDSGYCPLFKLRDLPGPSLFRVGRTKESLGGCRLLHCDLFRLTVSESTRVSSTSGGNPPTSRC